MPMNQETTKKKETSNTTLLQITRKILNGLNQNLSIYPLNYINNRHGIREILYQNNLLPLTKFCSQNHFW